MTHLTPEQIRHQDAIARDIVCAVAAYLETDDVPPRVILNAIEDATADLGLTTKETLAADPRLRLHRRIKRHLRTCGPLTIASLARDLQAYPDVVGQALRELDDDNEVIERDGDRWDLTAWVRNALEAAA